MIWERLPDVLYGVGTEILMIAFRGLLDARRGTRSLADMNGDGNGREGELPFL